MEEQKAKGEEISEETITSVKVGLMGPLAGVADPGQAADQLVDLALRAGGRPGPQI